MGYASNAQRKAVWASRNEKKSPAKMASPFKMASKSPLMGKISASCKARAKKKFKVWPSAYASGWGVRCTKGKV
jgi:hypothetical protein